MAKTREYAFVYLFGGIMYGLMEVIWRGHTHWTMTLTGGTALLILYIINIKMSNCNIFLKCLIGASAITLLEFTVGVIINIILKWNVWDYSNRPLNILGQVCPLFSFFGTYYVFRDLPSAALSKKKTETDVAKTRFFIISLFRRDNYQHNNKISRE